MQLDPDAHCPSEAQRRKLCDMLYHVLVEIRLLGFAGRGEQASDLADAFHNLPHDMWGDHFSFSHFREAFLAPYQRKWSTDAARDYLAMLSEAERLP